MKRYLIYQLKKLIGLLKEGERTPRFEKYERELEIKYNLERELNNHKINYPPEYFQETDDYIKNIQMYEEALEKIKEKYEPHVLSTQYLSGDDLIHMEIKRKNYCAKRNLLPEELEIINSETMKCYEEECELARLNLEIRDRNFCLADLRRAAELERKYENEKRAAELEKRADKLKEKAEKLLYKDKKLKEKASELKEKAKSLQKQNEEQNADLTEINNKLEKIKTLREEIAKEFQELLPQGIKFRNYVKNEMSIDIAFDIKSNKDPRGLINGQKYQTDWQKKLNILKYRLNLKGIYLDKNFEAEPEHEKIIKKTWDEINKEMKIERYKKLGFEKMYEEMEKKYPNKFSFDRFSEWLQTKYSDPDKYKPGNIQQDKFYQLIREFYDDVLVPEQQKKLKLEEYTENAKKMLAKDRMGKSGDITLGRLHKDNINIENYRPDYYDRGDNR